MVGFALSSFSVLYGLLVGLLAVAAYQNFSSVADIVDKEASSLGALYRDLEGYPEPTKGRLQDELRDYTRNVIDKSWPLQRLGIVPTESSPPGVSICRRFLGLRTVEERGGNRSGRSASSVE
jgi:hypothetical protein